MGDFSILGKNLKETRIKMGLTLDAVSNMTGVSKTMLSQIERGESVPTLSVAWKISNGLKIRLESLMRDREQQFTVSRIKDLKPLVNDKGNVFIYTVLPFSPESGCEVFYGELLPGCDYVSGGHLNSEFEHCLVLSGEVELITGGKHYFLKENEFITFDSEKEHRYLNHGEEMARFYSVLNY